MYNKWHKKTERLFPFPFVFFLRLTDQPQCMPLETGKIPDAMSLSLLLDLREKALWNICGQIYIRNSGIINEGQTIYTKIIIAVISEEIVNKCREEDATQVIYCILIIFSQDFLPLVLNERTIKTRHNIPVVGLHVTDQSARFNVGLLLQ